MESKFATYRLEALYELLNNDIEKISLECDVSRYQAEIRLIARLVGHETFYGALSGVLEISTPNEVAFDRLQEIKAMMFDAVREAYMDKACKIAAERLKENQS